eukprot:4638161-Lingulodinium_polyedra.AAC.1
MTLRAWIGVSKTELVVIMQRGGETVRTSESLFSVVLKAIDKWLPDISEENAMDLFAKRASGSMTNKSFWDSG